jgi:hypothetical protein
MKNFHDLQVKMLLIAIFLLIFAIIAYFVDNTILNIALAIAVIASISLFLKYLDLYMNLDKHIAVIHNLVKNPTFIDNRIWMHHDQYSDLFKAMEKYYKKNKTKLVLLRMQLDEIEQIKHKSAEGSEDFKMASSAIDFIENLQKKGVLTIRGIALKRIIDIEGEDDSDPKAPESEKKEEKKEIEEDNPLAEKGAEFKTPQEGRWKSRLAEGIKNIINDEHAKNIKQINLLSETPEIRVRVRAYVGLVKDRKVDIVDLKKATTSAKYVLENMPLTVDEKYKKSEIAKKRKKLEADKKKLKAKIDYVTKF